MKIKNLKQCPFCGGNAVIKQDVLFGDYFAGCADCHISTDLQRSEQEAIKIWEKRKIVNKVELKKRIAEIEVIKNYYYHILQRTSKTLIDIEAKNRAIFYMLCSMLINIALIILFIVIFIKAKGV